MWWYKLKEDLFWLLVFSAEILEIGERGADMKQTCVSMKVWVAWGSMISRQNYKSARFQWSKLLLVLRWQKNRGNVQENCCSSATKLCPALCNPMDYSTPCSSVLHYLPEFAQIHVHRFGDVIEPSHPLPPPSPIFTQCLQSFPASGLFQWAGFLPQMAKVLELQHQYFQWIFRVDFL